jgi:SAM-dependent methyltransferase
MDDVSLLIDLHQGTQRQGPGSTAATSRALALAGLEAGEALKVLDIGCGTGASTLQLAQELHGSITAVDLAPEFIATLKERAVSAGVAERIDTLVGSMEELPFADGEFDLIWSEGAVYNMGFERGVSAWRRLLAPGGILVVSEITWTNGSRPQALEDYWQAQYPEIDTAGAKITVLERCGYGPVGYFVLAPDCWLENYYLPLAAGFRDFLARHPDDRRAVDLIEAENEEIAFYNKYQSWYSYGVYVARRAE